MKIARIHIDRFGLWNQFDLNLNSGGLSLLSGPNEAGKTTLLRFLRGMLFGFCAADLSDSPNDVSHGGSIELQHGESTVRIERRRSGSHKDKLAIHGLNRVGPPNELLADLVGHIGRHLFENVFAVGLHEMQQLAGLHVDEAAERLYGVSLGSEGRRLLNAVRQTQARRQRLLNVTRSTGSVFNLLAKDRQLSERLRHAGVLRNEYERLIERRRDIDSRINELRSRLGGMESQLRGHRFLERVWGPWKEVEEYRGELHDLPDLDGFPNDGIARLDALEAEIDSEQRCRAALVDEIEQLKQQRDAVRSNSNHRQINALMRKLVRRRERIERLLSDRSKSQTKITVLRDELEKHCAQLGDEWTVDRLESVDTSSVAQYELLQSARQFQNAIVRRGRFRKLYQRHVEAFRKLRAKVDTRRRRLGDVPPAPDREDQPTVPSAAKEARELQRQEQRLRERRNELRQDGDAGRRLATLPLWFVCVLWFFAIAGGLVALVGLATAITSNTLAGAILALSGLTGLGMSWGLKYHTESVTRERSGGHSGNLESVEEQLAQTRQALARLANQGILPESESADLVTAPSTQNPVKPLFAHKLLAARERKLEKRKRRLVQLRSRFASVRQHFSEARQQWLDTLNAVGLTETLNLSEAFDEWQRVFDVHETMRLLRDEERSCELLEERCETWLRRISKLASLKNTAQPVPGVVPAFLQRCEEELRSTTADSMSSAQLASEIRKRRDEARDYTKRIKSLKRQRSALLTEAGAANREEFERRAELLTRRCELEELLELAQDELTKAAETEPELAIVEEDLREFDPQQNAGCIAALEAELADLQRDLQSLHEERGRVNHEREQLEANTEQSRLLFEHRQLERSLQQSVEQWAAERLVEQSLNEVRERFERENQPAVLTAASELLEQMTDGRYPRLWAPLGSRRVCADDGNGRTWQLDELSGGTREQIFLALRLALVEEFAEDGPDLPLILDDVLVNFDHRRTSAAVDALLNMARRGRQIVFLTCHQHIAELFRRKGIAPQYLPSPLQYQEQRLAG